MIHSHQSIKFSVGPGRPANITTRIIYNNSKNFVLYISWSGINAVMIAIHTVGVKLLFHYHTNYNEPILTKKLLENANIGPFQKNKLTLFCHHLLVAKEAVELAAASNS